jgi:hypothetical protein
MTTETRDLEALQKRLRKVERRSREACIGFCVLVILLIGVGVFWTTFAFTTNTMVAKCYAVKDAAGNTRAQLSVTEGSTVCLYFCGADGGYPINLSVAKDGTPKLWLNDQHNRKRFEAELLSDGRPMMAFYAEEKKLALLAGIDEFGDSFLDPYDKNGVPQASIETKAGGSPLFEIVDDQGRTLFGAP